MLNDIVPLPINAPPLNSSGVHHNPRHVTSAAATKPARKISCFVCSNCEAPLCHSSDLIPAPIDSSMTSHTFAYELEDLLDVEAGVWCYNCSEDITTTVTVPEGLTPAAATSSSPQQDGGGVSHVERTSRRFDIVRVSAASTINVTVCVVPTASPSSLLNIDASSTEDEMAERSQIHQVRSSFTERWFTKYSHQQRLMCCECKEHVGFLFERDGSDDHNEDDEEEEVDRTSRRDDLQVEDRFCGLMLRTLKQREWSLADVVTSMHRCRGRYPANSWTNEGVLVSGGSAAGGQQQSSTTYEDVMLRLQSLHTQTTLYADLLQKHKEQSDVQRQLLVSQKDRISAHEEKIATLQQIVEAQRQQLDMQHRHLGFQEELVRNQRDQIRTQQQQIDVEQLLLGEQNRTIHSQLEQMRSLQAHLKAKDDRLRLALEIQELQRLALLSKPTAAAASVAAAVASSVSLLQREGGQDAASHASPVPTTSSSSSSVKSVDDERKGTLREV